MPINSMAIFLLICNSSKFWVSILYWLYVSKCSFKKKGKKQKTCCHFWNLEKCKQLTTSQSSQLLPRSVSMFHSVSQTSSVTSQKKPILTHSLLKTEKQGYKISISSEGWHFLNHIQIHKTRKISLHSTQPTHFGSHVNTSHSFHFIGVSKHLFWQRLKNS